MIDTILAIARQLGLGVVAEGIESPEQFSFLIGRGCPLFQGYHFGRPQPAEDFLVALGPTLRNPMMRR